MIARRKIIECASNLFVNEWNVCRIIKPSMWHWWNFISIVDSFKSSPNANPIDTIVNCGCRHIRQFGKLWFAFNCWMLFVRGLAYKFRAWNWGSDWICSRAWICGWDWILSRAWIRLFFQGSETCSNPGLKYTWTRNRNWISEKKCNLRIYFN